jgi:hypothetical protein
MAIGMMALIAFGAWATGCTGLSDDCELNLNCAPSQSSSAGPTCSGQYFSATCDGCLRESCCQTLSDCDEDGACINYCAFGVLPSPPECNSPPTSTLFQSLTECLKTTCAGPCEPPDRCNPVTNAGCAPDGSQCDLVYPGMFVCFAPFGATPGALCAPCDNLTGPFCGPGLRCHAGSKTCARFCCNDADCGTGRCELNQMLAFGATTWHPEDMVGVCVTQDGTTCSPDAPAVSSSGGTCFAGFPGQ